jgi:putative PIN family toxin of toxin-antitoxin system
MRPVVVFDTSTLISAVLSLIGNPFRCVAMARMGLVQSVTCEEILAEFADKLRAKFDYPAQLAAEAADEIRRSSQIISITGTLKAVPGDSDDDKVVECAVLGAATHIVSGDRRHLLALGSYRGVQIITPRQLLTLVSPS